MAIQSDQANRVIIIGNTTYTFPEHIKGNSVSVINNKVYVDGYELKNGAWKRTIRALYHQYF